jgi:hypothetical protein
MRSMQAWDARWVRFLARSPRDTRYMYFVFRETVSVRILYPCLQEWLNTRCMRYVRIVRYCRNYSRSTVDRTGDEVGSCCARARAPRRARRTPYIMLASSAGARGTILVCWSAAWTARSSAAFDAPNELIRISSAAAQCRRMHEPRRLGRTATGRCWRCHQ